MRRKITLLRHGMPEVDASVSPEEWPLSSDGAAAASALRLDGTAVSSPELKARQTTVLATGAEEGTVVQDARFREVDREELVHDDFRSARRAWVAGRLDERHVSWETPDDVAQRFHEGLLAHPAEHIVVGTHGMALTAWTVAQGLIEAGDPAVAFWETLRFPDVIELDLPLPRVRALLTDDDGRIILIKRTRAGHAPYWTTPGGGMALSDATPEDALRRELREELGAEAWIGEVIHERRIDGIRSEIFYAARLTGIDPSRRNGPEFDDPSRGRYDIERVALDRIADLDLRPAELVPVLRATSA
ncbi:NUDIX domain-containing protein [Microbacterium bovistercoris]|nr:NUDIX domain-containing protein [Microbacterium bovistercoris]